MFAGVTARLQKHKVESHWATYWSMRWLVAELAVSWPFDGRLDWSFQRPAMIARTAIPITRRSPKAMGNLTGAIVNAGPAGCGNVQEVQRTM